MAYRALYDFDGSGTDQGLSLTKGLIIDVLEKVDTGWWKGQVTETGATGWFPTAYVEELPQRPPINAPPPPSSAPPRNPPQPDHAYAEIASVRAEATAAAANATGAEPVAQAVPKPSSVPPPKPGGPPPKPGAPPPPRPTGAAPPKPGGAPPPKPQGAPQPPPTGVAYFEEVGPQQNLPPVQGTGYCDNFWNDKGGKTGFDILVLKHRNGKEVCKDIADYLKQRAAIEDTYSKALAKLHKAKESSYTDIGMTRAAWLTVKAELKMTADAHAKFGEMLANDLEKKIMSFKDSQKGTRKQYEASISERRKSLSSTVPTVERLHDDYCSLCLEAHKWSEQAALGQQDHQTKRDYTKISDTAVKMAEKRDAAGAAYKSALTTYNETQLQWINEMLLACKEFEDAEVARIEFLKNFMKVYAEQGKRTSECTAEAFSMVADAYAAVISATDIAEFTSTSGTGQDRPRPFPFASPAVIVEDAKARQAGDSKSKSTRRRSKEVA